MNKAEVKKAGLPVGLFMLALAALLSLGACNDGIIEDWQQQEEPTQTTALENGLVEVKVALPQNTTQNSRVAITDEVAKVFIDYYEVIFQDTTDKTKYFIGTAEAGKEYLSIAVPAGTYNILLLAGTKVNRVLLATGFVNKIDAGTKLTAFGNTGSGVPITLGKVNIITLELTMTNIKVKDSVVVSPDVDFTGKAPAYSRDSDGNLILKLDKTKTGEDLVLNFNTAKLVDLVRAKDASMEKLNVNQFETNKATLKPRYQDGFFNVQQITGIVYNDTYFQYKFLHASGFPEFDVDGLITLNLEYYAFSDPQSNSSKWNIRPGINYGIDNDTTVGGAIQVKVGSGSGNVGIEFVMQD